MLQMIKIGHLCVEYTKDSRFKNCIMDPALKHLGYISKTPWLNFNVAYLAQSQLLWASTVIVSPLFHLGQYLNCLISSFTFIWFYLSHMPSLKARYKINRIEYTIKLDILLCLLIDYVMGNQSHTIQKQCDTYALFHSVECP